MTNKEVIKRINSLYQMPTDEQIGKVLETLGKLNTALTFDETIEFIKQHYYD